MTEHNTTDTPTNLPADNSTDESAEPSGAHSAYSYIRRRGRATKAQVRGLEHLHQYAIQPEDIGALAAPRGIEIGFGMGQALAGWAQAEAHMQLVGIELYEPGLGALCDTLAKGQISNVRVSNIPAQEVLAQVASASIREIRILFPDPWPKKRHAKRRLVQPEFIAEVTRVLEPRGVLRLATDWAPYAAWMREVLSTATGLAQELDVIRAADAGSDQRDQSTKYEARGERLGHQIHDLVYLRSA